MRDTFIHHFDTIFDACNFYNRTQQNDDYFEWWTNIIEQFLFVVIYTQSFDFYLFPNNVLLDAQFDSIDQQDHNDHEHYGLFVHHGRRIIDFDVTIDGEKQVEKKQGE